MIIALAIVTYAAYFCASPTRLSIATTNKPMVSLGGYVGVPLVGYLARE